MILATGYKSKVEEFLENTKGVFNAIGEPGAPIINENKGLYFIGFNLYYAGVLYSIYKKSELIVKDILLSRPEIALHKFVIL